MANPASLLRITRKVHPHGLVSSSSSAPCYFTSKQETFTIWMKSLVLNGKGCTVFDSDGHIMYRVDNYNSKCNNEVHLMDFDGKGLFTIKRTKRFRLFDSWEGYKSSTDEAEVEAKRPGFKVRRSFKILSRDLRCEVIIGSENNEPSYNYYVMKSLSNNSKSKSACKMKIVDSFGEIVAETKRKEVRKGVVLGEDVLTMEVKPCVDHSLIMGLLVVYSLVNSKM